MDAVLQTLGGSLPQLGVGGVLTFVIGLLVKLLIDERNSHDAELERKGARMLVEIAHKDEELARLSKRIEDLEVTVDIERAARRDAEDVAARALRRAPREKPAS